MDSVTRKSILLAILNEDWTKLIKHSHTDNVLNPITTSEDTVLQMAVYSRKSSPLKELLDIALGPSPGTDKVINVLSIENAHGDTVLHEAVWARNYEAIDLIVGRCRQLAEHKNKRGMTPLYAAASVGMSRTVNKLAKLEGQMTRNNRLSAIHVEGPDSTSILHVAINGKHYKTAYELITMDKSLGNLKDSEGRTALHLLADMPSDFRSGYSMNIFELLLYSCIPVQDVEALDDVEEDGQKRNKRSPQRYITDLSSINISFSFFKVLKYIYLQIFKKLGTGIVERMLKEKQRHEYASRLAKKLIGGYFNDNTLIDNEVKEGESIDDYYRITIESEEGVERGSENPLFIATSRGITEIVQEVLRSHPHAVAPLNNLGQNLLHVSILHRQKQTFGLLKGKRILWKRMSRVIDNNGCTLLHQVAETKYYTEGTKHGPALQLQEELQWFEDVGVLCPDYYITHRDKVYNMTAKERFRKTHQDKMLIEAQKWIKETSQSCSAVAVLVATVVYAAIYTVPGGNNKKGVPVFLNSPYFVFFTVMDVAALAGSLTSVVMFLSILTSSFDLLDFHRSLPWKLNLGFMFLFFSILATMLSFGATILLVISQEKEWTASLISVAAFLPISVFVIMQHKLYSALWEYVYEFFKLITEKAIDWISYPFKYFKKKDVNIEIQLGP